MVRYWIDTNVLIHAKDVTYPMAHAKSFWSWLDREINKGRIVSAKRVYEELVDGRKQQDDLALWVKDRKHKGLCIPRTPSCHTNATKIGDYLFGGRYKSRHALKFSRGADPWLIAQAMTDKGTVVTQESSQHPEAEVVRIPDVCHHYEVKCINLTRLFEELNAEF